MQNVANVGLKPRLTLTAEDHARLSQLASGAARTMPEVASELAAELERADVLGRGERPSGVVCMGSEVEFRDEASGQLRTVTLVYPADADIARARVSVLTPIGTALIGLSSGQSIDWMTRAGEVRRLTVLAVRDPDAVAPRGARAGGGDARWRRGVRGPILGA